MKTTIQSIIKYCLWAALFVTTSVFAADFTEPLEPPPAGNPDAPINVGSVSQTRTGPLTIENTLTTDGLISTTDGYFSTNISVGTPNDPSLIGLVGLFEGKVGATEYCDNTGANCITTSTVTSGGIPSGAVMAFDLATCPSGWSTYTTATGRQIIGSGSGSYVDAGTTVNRTFTVGETGGLSDIKSHKHKIYNLTQNSPSGTATFQGLHYSVQSSTNPQTMDAGDAKDSKDLLDPYVALLYCKKN